MKWIFFLNLTLATFSNLKNYDVMNFKIVRHPLYGETKNFLSKRVLILGLRWCEFFFLNLTLATFSDFQNYDFMNFKISFTRNWKAFFLLPPYIIFAFILKSIKDIFTISIYHSSLFPGMSTRDNPSSLTASNVFHHLYHTKAVKIFLTLCMINFHPKFVK